MPKPARKGGVQRRRLVAINANTIGVNGRKYRTLRDVLPKEPGLRALFIAKTPAPISVSAGHYFQGRQGAAFWKRLKQYALLKPTTIFEDDSMLAHGFGLTDIVKVPRRFGNEPSDAEYLAGSARILRLIRLHKPKIVVFVYKRALEQLLKLRFGVATKAVYGFNPALARYFRAEVFAFPLPGVGGCTREEAHLAMIALCRQLADR